MTAIDYSREERNWAMACHLSALVGFIILPFCYALGPLVVWFFKKNEIKSVNLHGKEALNFQLSMTFYMIISGFLILSPIGVFLLMIVMLADLVLTITAATKIYKGEDFQYPFTIRLLK